MKEIDRWEYFLKNEALPTRTNLLRALYDHFCINKEALKKDLVQLFDVFCLEIEKQQLSGSMGKCVNFQVSLMRTSLMERRPVYMLLANDIASLSKTRTSPIFYNAGWIFNYMNTWITELEEYRRAYLDQIKRLSFEAWLNEQVYPFHMFMVHIVRYAMDEIIQLASYQNVLKEALFDIRVGEYMDQGLSESVFRNNESQRSSVTCKGWLESRLHQEYIFEHIAHVNISHGNYQEINLLFTRLESVVLSGSSFQNSILLGSKFVNCTCDQVNFHGSVIFDADFRNCNLESAVFDHCMGTRDVMNEKHGTYFGLHGVQFMYANLKNASFQGARIAGDFSYAELEGIDFTGAELTGSRMLKRDIFKVSLTENQHRSITWIEE
ncbi:Pentapeptide repeats (8 copies) [compost metagenome]